MKPTPKHLRPRWRYLAVEIEGFPDCELKRDTVKRALNDAIDELFGDSGNAKTRFRIFSFIANAHRAEAVIRTHRDAIAITRAGLACIDSVTDDPVRVFVRGISGTVRSCEEKFLGRDQELIRETAVVFDGVNRHAVKAGDEIDIKVNDGYVGATTLDIK